MARSQLDHLPAYKRIQVAIVRRIEAGELKSGDPVGSERELAKVHSVSLMTARHALADLSREGLVERRRGSGTFVAPPKIHFNKLMSFTEQMSGRSLSARSRILSLGVVNDEPEIAARLVLPAHSSLVRFERLRVGGAEPFAIETCYLSASQFRGLSRAALERGSLYSCLERDHGVSIAYADEEIDATVADPQSARLLGVQRDEPLLRIRQVVYSTKSIPTIYMSGLYRSDRHTLNIRRYR
jgi:GntR family transcriptional regulator